jgi:asparagine synthetase B (glutamine-hydrolysing)
MAKDLLDRRILERSKNGFRVPVGAWFRTEQREAMRDLLETSTSRVRQILNAAVLQRILDEHMTARQNHEKLLWTISNLELFLRQVERPGGYLTGAAPVSTQLAATAGDAHPGLRRALSRSS